MFSLEKNLRLHLRKALGYSSARSEFKGEAEVLLDANENPYDTGFNRYPDPQALALRKALAREQNLNENQIAIGNGSDEWIDLLLRLFVEPQLQSALLMTPTYGMYQVSAVLNNVNCISVPLKTDFDLDLDASLKVLGEENIALVFLCSPNNPTGNLFNPTAVERILKSTEALVVVDEAYIHYSSEPSWTQSLQKYPNLIVLQTFSKAIGLAALRVGILYASPQIVELLQKFKAPYNVNAFSQEMALRILSESKWREQVKETVEEREKLSIKLAGFDFVKKVYPSQANFILCVFTDSQAVYQLLKENNIIVRQRQKELAGALRISVGTPVQNEKLLKVLSQYED